MFCSQCGVIIGRKFPKGLYKCAHCDNILRVAAFRIIDEKDSFEYISLESSRRRLCTVFTDEAKINFLLKQQTDRHEEWLPFALCLEEERLRAFVKRLGWIIASIQRDTGPTVPEEERPYVQIERDLKDSITNTIVVTDFGRVTRKALHSLYAMASQCGAEIVAISPHRCDENLEFSHVDYDIIPGYLTKNFHLERIWTKGCDKRLEELMGRYGWHWTSYAADVLSSEIGPEAIRAWREEDAACAKRHWKEVLTYWAIGYVRRNKLYRNLPLPDMKSCTACKRKYLASAIPIHLAEMSQFRDYHCRSCLNRAFFYTPARIDRFLRNGPASNIKEMETFIEMFSAMDKDRFDQVVRKVLEWRDLDRKNSGSHVWLKAFIDAGFIKGFGALASSETVFRALDGHACMTLGAVMVDNYMYMHGVSHEVDVRYPRHAGLNKTGSLRADFSLGGDIIMEFAGLWGDEEFKKDMERREELCEKNRLTLIKIYTEDLICPQLLERKLEPFVVKEEPSAEEPEKEASEESTQEKS